MLRLTGIALVLSLAVLLVAPAGSPVSLGYVTSDSMEPTISEDDGYLLVPADPVRPGDVVTFESPDGDGYVTHRVVAETAAGYVTRGDANPSTDQSAGAPPVREGEVVGEVLTVGGSPVVVPGLGTAVELARSNPLPVVALLGLVAVAGTGGSRRGHDRDRGLPRDRDLFVAFLAVGLVVGTAVVVDGGRVHGNEYVATETPSGGPDTVTVGTNRTETLRINRTASPLTRVFVDARGMTVTNVTRNATAVTVRTRLSAPDRIGPFSARLGVYRYPAVLPAGLTRWLIGVHPALAALVSVAATLSPLGLAALATDGKRPVRPSRRRWIRRLFGGED